MEQSSYPTSDQHSMAEPVSAQRRKRNRVRELRDVCFFVDPFERPGATERSLSGLRAAHLWLRRGGTLVAFPAGEVAHRRQPDGSVVDSP